MRETREIGLLLWTGLWTIAGVTAWCLALVGAGWQHLLIGVVAFALASAPVAVPRALAARGLLPRSPAPVAVVTPLEVASTSADDPDETDDSASTPGRSGAARSVDRVA